MIYPKKLQIMKNQRGAVTIITAFILIALLVATAFVVDFGLTYLSTAELQNAADSAALAAAALLPVNDGDTSGIQAVKQKAVDYIEKNGIGGDYTTDVEVHLGDNAIYSSVTVSIYRQEELHIAPVIGVTHLDVVRSATAQVSPTISAKNLVPLSITKDYLSDAMAAGDTQHLELKLGASDKDVKQGAFGALDLNGSQGGGSSDYRDWLENGYQGSLSIGDQLPVETGNMSNPTMSAFTARYNSCTHYASDGGCTVNHYVVGCPRVVIVPVITYKNAHTVIIEGFAAFVIEGCAGQGNNSIITGSFLEGVPVNGEGSLDDDIGSDIDFGVYSVSLIK